MKPIIIFLVAIYIVCAILLIMLFPKSVVLRFLHKRAFTEIFENEDKAEKAITLELKDSALHYAFIPLYNLLFALIICLNTTIYGGVIKQKEEMMYDVLMNNKDKILEQYKNI